MGMGQILIIYVTHSSIHLVEEEPTFNMANLLLHPPPAPVLLKPPEINQNIVFGEASFIDISSHLNPQACDISLLPHISVRGEGWPYK